MTTNTNEEKSKGAESLGQILRQARLENGYTYKGLAQMSGVAQSQISKLEQDQIRKPNPAHLAALAEPLGLTLVQVYQAAGYKAPAQTAALTPELEQALGSLPHHALAQVEQYIGQLVREHGGASPAADEFAEA